MISDYEERKRKAGKIILMKSVKWCCPNCGEVFEEVQIRNAAQKYIVQNPDAIQNGVRSFFVNGFASPWLTWSDIMKEWLTVRGDPMREMNVYNTRFGLSYEMPSELEESTLAELQDYPAAIPDEVMILTAGVDVQKDRLEYAVYGWHAGGGYGILRGVVEGSPTEKSTWVELDTRLNLRFTNAAGREYRIERTFVDSGFATEYVYGYCRSRMKQGRFAIKGYSRFGQPLIIKTGVLKDAGIYLVILNSDAGKDEVIMALQSGKILYGRDDQFLTRNFDENFFKQLSSEYKVKTASGYKWEKVNAHARNEALDMTVYALAALKSLMTGEDFWNSLTKKKPPVRRQVISRELGN